MTPSPAPQAQATSMPSTTSDGEVLGVGHRRFERNSLPRRLWQALTQPRRAWMVLTRKRGYRQAWDSLGADRQAAYAMVDTSRDEEELTRRGIAVARLLKQAMLIEPTHAVLEIGCGPARIGRELAPHCREWIGADISQQMISRGQARTGHLRNVRFVTLAGAELPAFADRSLDRIYCHSVLVHIDKEDMFRYLREIARTLRPGGIAYVDTWNVLAPESWQWFMTTVEQSSLTGRKEVYRPQFSTTAELRCMLEHAGLTELVLQDDSHLLQAFVTVVDPGRDDAAMLADMRRRIAASLPSIRGLD